ncbi:hypothetical protein G6F40_016605 [Rhizopus arrhizus]|nr:hypothetical protein G6F40_016605 [Rhizopus arrhizus]
MSKRPVSSSSLSGTSPKLDKSSLASRFSPRSTARVSCSNSSSTWSTLLTTITSANSTCSHNRSTTPRSSSGPACWPRSARRRVEPKSARNALPSTTVTIVSNRAMSLRLKPCSSRTAKVAATGRGAPLAGGWMSG